MNPAQCFAVFTHPWVKEAFLVFCLIFALREFFTWKNNLPLKYILSPAVTISLIAPVLISLDIYGISFFGVMILGGLVFSLVADTLLMIKETDLLRYGIVYFFTAHIFYVSAFSSGYFFKLSHIPAALILITGGFAVYRLIALKAGRLKPAVSAYIVVIMTMAYFAAAMGLNGRSWLAGAGAVLFLISDCCLAYNAFVKPVKHSSVITWATYAPAQALFVLSAFSAV